jgi:hypothetical protein
MREATPTGVMRRVVGLSAGILTLSMTTGVVADAPRAPANFTTRYPLVLGFDLRDDSHPKAALAVNAGLPDGTAVRDVNVQLPFPISSWEDNEAAAFRVGRYPKWTLISYWAGGPNWPQSISLRPAVDRVTSSDEINEKVGGVHIVAQGQLRHFYYHYSDVATDGRLPAGLKGLALRAPDAIAIDLPDKAKEISVGEGQLSKPARLIQSERAFTGNQATANVADLEIVYELPPTDFQKFVVLTGVKLIAAIMSVFGLVAVSRDKVKRPRLRIAAIAAAGVAVPALLVLTLWSAYATGDWQSTISDLLILAVTTAASVAVFFSTRQDDPAAPPSPPAPPPLTPAAASGP